jgi:hypothetical protein
VPLAAAHAARRARVRVIRARAKFAVVTSRASRSIQVERAINRAAIAFTVLSHIADVWRLWPTNGCITFAYISAALFLHRRGSSIARAPLFNVTNCIRVRQRSTNNVIAFHQVFAARIIHAIASFGQVTVIAG